MDFQQELQRMLDSGEIDSGLLSGKRRTPRELKRSNVVLVAKIGAGAFGEVHKGVLDELKDGGVPGCVALRCFDDLSLTCH